MYIKLHGVTSYQGRHHCSEKLNLNHKHLFTDMLTIKLLTHTTIRYLNLQSHIEPNFFPYKYPNILKPSLS